MQKINLRLKDVIPALLDCGEPNFKTRVIGDDDETIIDKKVTLDDVVNDVYGISSIYSYDDITYLEIKKDLEYDEEDVSDDEQDDMDSIYDVVQNDDDEFADFIKDQIYSSGPRLVKKTSKIEDKKGEEQVTENGEKDKETIEIIDYSGNYSSDSDISLMSIKLSNGETKTMQIVGDYMKLSHDELAKMMEQRIKRYIECGF